MLVVRAPHCAYYILDDIAFISSSSPSTKTYSHIFITLCSVAIWYANKPF